MDEMDTANPIKGFFQTTKRRLQLLDTTAVTFTRSRATQSAASLAYYTFFSIFPLMLLFILGGSYFLDRQSVYLRVTQAVQNVLPISQQFIATNLQQVLKQRAAVGVFVLVSLLWSASNVFNNLAYDINMAWPEARARNFLQTRLIGLDMIAGLTGLLIVSIVLESVSNWLGANAGTLSFNGWNVWAVLSNLASWIAVFLLFMAMYRWVPTVHVPWVASFWGALAASIGWKAASTGFAWYLGSGFARYQLVYGSLGAIVAFLFLIYIIALITLFGAHLTAAVDHFGQERQNKHRPNLMARGSPETQRRLASSDTANQSSGDDSGADLVANSKQRLPATELRKKIRKEPVLGAYRAFLRRVGPAILTAHYSHCKVSRFDGPYVSRATNLAAYLARSGELVS